MYKLAGHSSAHRAPVSHVGLPWHVLDNLAALTADAQVPTGQADRVLGPWVTHYTVIAHLLRRLTHIIITSFFVVCRIFVFLVSCWSCILICIDLINFKLILVHIRRLIALTTSASTEAVRLLGHDNWRWNVSLCWAPINLHLAEGYLSRQLIISLLHLLHKQIYYSTE